MKVLTGLSIIVFIVISLILFLPGHNEHTREAHQHYRETIRFEEQHIIKCAYYIRRLEMMESTSLFSCWIHLENFSRFLKYYPLQWLKNHGIDDSDKSDDMGSAELYTMVDRVSFCHNHLPYTESYFKDSATSCSKHTIQLINELEQTAIPKFRAAWVQNILGMGMHRWLNAFHRFCTDVSNLAMSVVNTTEQVLENIQNIAVPDFCVAWIKSILGDWVFSTMKTLLHCAKDVFWMCRTLESTCFILNIEMIPIDEYFIRAYRVRRNQIRMHFRALERQAWQAMNGQ